MTECWHREQLLQIHSQHLPQLEDSKVTWFLGNHKDVLSTPNIAANHPNHARVCVRVRVCRACMCMRVRLPSAAETRTSPVKSPLPL
jgi:hypothetical protein